MRRIALGAATAAAVWLGSGLLAEAQQGGTITPTGPLSVIAGSSSSTYTATIYIPNTMNFMVKLWVYKNGTAQNYSATNVPNTGAGYYNFSQFVDMSTWIPAAGDTLVYKAQLLWNRTITYAADWTVIVSGTRPSSKTTYQGSTSLAFEGVNRDRRRE